MSDKRPFFKIKLAWSVMIMIILLLNSFLCLLTLMDFHRIIRENKSLKVSNTLVSIFTDLDNGFNLDGLDVSFDFQTFRSLLQSQWDFSMIASYN